MRNGLDLSPATEWAMNITLRPVFGKNTFIYLEDLIIARGTIDEHIKDLREVFSLLNEAGLKINAFKYKFLATELR
ncbi:Retrovirus-related Pol polyprotein from transposon 17.6, partial [Stegodyphus mimosarum]